MRPLEWVLIQSDWCPFKKRCGSLAVVETRNLVLERRPGIVLRKWQTNLTQGKLPASIRPNWRRRRCRRTSCQPKGPLSRRRGVKFLKTLEDSPLLSSWKLQSWSGERASAWWTWVTSCTVNPGTLRPWHWPVGLWGDPPNRTAKFSDLPWDIVENYLYD